MKRSLQIFFVFFALSFFLSSCGSDAETVSDAPSESESSGDLPDGSAFMAFERLSSDQAFVTVDLTDDAVAGYLTDCDLGLEMQGTDTQTPSGQTVGSGSGVQIWAADSETIYDANNASYPADGDNQIAEILVSDSYFSFDEPILVRIQALNCDESGFLYEIEDTLN